MSFTCTLAFIAVLITLPIIVLLWATESPSVTAKRLRSRGWTYERIGRRLRIDRRKASALCKA